jgi:hypothetical protein
MLGSLLFSGCCMKEGGCSSMEDQDVIIFNFFKAPYNQSFIRWRTWSVIYQNKIFTKDYTDDYFDRIIIWDKEDGVSFPGILHVVINAIDPVDTTQTIEIKDSINIEARQAFTVHNLQEQEYIFSDEFQLHYTFKLKDRFCTESLCWVEFEY